MPSDLSVPVSVIAILITTVLIVDPNLASAQKVIINIDGGWRFYPNKSHFSCIHLISSQSLVDCQHSLQRLVWRRSHGQSEVLHQSQAAGNSIFSPLHHCSTSLTVLCFKGMEGKYKDCEGIDKEYFPCNVEPCDMQVR